MNWSLQCRGQSATPLNDSAGLEMKLSGVGLKDNEEIDHKIQS